VSSVHKQQDSGPLKSSCALFFSSLEANNVRQLQRQVFNTGTFAQERSAEHQADWWYRSIAAKLAETLCFCFLTFFLL